MLYTIVITAANCPNTRQSSAEHFTRPAAPAGVAKGNGMNKYKRLVSNTILTAINQFSSKLLGILMTAYYTRQLTTGEFGLMDTVQTTGQFFIPLVLLGIQNAVVRFGLESRRSHHKIYTSGLVALGSGYLILLIIWPLLSQFDFIATSVGPYGALMLVFLLTSCFNTLNCQLTRAQGNLRLYAIDGILNSAVTLVCTVFYISGLGLRPEGMLLAVITGDFISAMFLFFALRMWRFVSFRSFDKELMVRMLRFSLPLVSASICWSITNTSDKLFITNILGPEATGLMSACYRLPTLLSIVATMFTEAWQISAFTDGSKAGREAFFSRVFDIYQGIMFMAAAGIIWLCQPIMRVYVGKEFFSAWEFVPLFTFATIFSSLSNFQNSIYMLEMKSGLSLLTMAAGAVLNLILNAALIPSYGIQGAAIATAASYFVIFLIRAFSTRRLLRMSYRPVSLAINVALLCIQSIILLMQKENWAFWLTIATYVTLLFNLKSFVDTVTVLLSRRKKRAKS